MKVEKAIMIPVILDGVGKEVPGLKARLWGMRNEDLEPLYAIALDVIETRKAREERAERKGETYPCDVCESFDCLHCVHNPDRVV